MQDILDLLRLIPTDHMWYCLYCEETIPSAPLRCASRTAQQLAQQHTHAQKAEIVCAQAETAVVPVVPAATATPVRAALCLCRMCDGCQLACHGACYVRAYGQPLAAGAAAGAGGKGLDTRVLCVSCQDPELQTLQVCALHRLSYPA